MPDETAVLAQIVPPVDDAGNPVELPNITKTDARTLTSLVRRDYEMLSTELGHRKNILETELRDQRIEREKEDDAIASRELAGLVRRVTTLNNAISAKLTELRDAGWTHRNNQYRPTHDSFDPTGFGVTFNGSGFVPPERDNSDIEAQQTQLDSDFYAVRSTLERQEADIVRQLALQSVTSDGAREMILSLPTPESLLSMPALEA